MNIQAKKCTIIIFVLVGGILYIGNSLFNENDTESTFKQTQNDVHIWSSNSPSYVMNVKEASTNINNIKAIQKEGWKLFVQDGQPVSFNGSVSGRNEIIENTVRSLLNGCYELSIDTDGNVVDVMPSEDARKLLKDLQKQEEEKINLQKQAEQEEINRQEKDKQQNEHDIQYNIVQNNITDINRLIENGYRFKMSNDRNGTITTWNITNKDDASPSLDYSINRLMSLGISINTDTEGKVIGFDFNQTEFYDDDFNLYGMTQ